MILSVAAAAAAVVLYTSYNTKIYCLCMCCRCYRNSPLEYQGLDYQIQASTASAGVGATTSNTTMSSTTSTEDSKVRQEDRSSALYNVAMNEEKEHDSGDHEGKDIGEAMTGMDSKEIANEIDSTNGIGTSAGAGGEDEADTESDVPEPAGVDETTQKDGEYVEMDGGRSLNLPQFSLWLPRSVVELAQVFSIVGGIGLVALWSVARRRRYSGGGSRRSSILPLFWRSTRGRNE